jgi:hypothetical protein
MRELAVFGAARSEAPASVDRPCQPFWLSYILIEVRSDERGLSGHPWSPTASWPGPGCLLTCSWTVFILFQSESDEEAESSG